MDRRTLLRMSGVALAGGVAGCGGSSSDDATDDGDGTGTAAGTASGGAVVEMTDGLKFQPAQPTIDVGETVTWKNVGAVAHSVTAYEDDLPDGAEYFASGGFDSESAARDGYPTEGSIGGNESYEHTFETTGEFPYFCIPHESGMKGTIVVE